jgi:hypothetical protein
VVLTAAELAGIEAALARVPVQGDRYSAERQKLVGR